MAKHLTASDLKAIVNFIYGLEVALLNWEKICDGVAPLVGKRPTRQSLSSHAAILSAYTSRKKEARNAQPIYSKPASLSIASQRIRRLEAEIADLKRQNQMLLEQFVVIQYNAYRHGLKESQLTLPLPDIDRERTKVR
jgi:hypothetical protein